MSESIDNLYDTLNYNEWRSRKYNILINGWAIERGKDIYRTLSDFFIRSLGLNADEESRVIIANAHILPIKHSDVSSSKSPPMIVKFVKLQDRNYILSEGDKNEIGHWSSIRLKKNWDIIFTGGL